MKKNTWAKITSLALITTVTLQPLPIFAYSKTESVYSNLNANGTIQKTTVNNHLSKLEKQDIEDETILKEIMNLNGEEKFKQEENKLIWKSTGKDIFYEGATDQEHPLDIHIKYYLNGKEMTPKKMKNKKGQVSIKISLENKAYKSTQNLHVPFVVTTGMILDSTKNSDISITNGEVVETGSRSMIVALAAPGLYDDLRIKELSSLDEITINYTTTKFSLSNIYLVATPKLLEKIDTSSLNKANTLSSSIDTIQENMNKIDNGAKSLNDGAVKLNDGSSIITDSLNKVLEAIEKLETGSISIDSGVEQVANALTVAKQQLDTSSLIYLQNANEKAANTLLSSLQMQGLTNDLVSLFNNYTLVSFGLGGTYNDSQTANNALQNYLLNSPYANQTTNLMQLKSLYDVYLLLNADATAFKQTSEKINDLSSKIDVLLSGLSNLKNGTTELTTGIQTLKVGINSLYAGATTLTQGTKDLRNGMDTLSNGITTLNKEGINKLTTTTKKISNYGKTITELVNLSRDYKGYASKNSNKTMFIYKVNSAK